MIRLMYFNNVGRESYNTSMFGSVATNTNVAKLMTEHLEQTKDTLVFIITKEQQKTWDHLATTYDWSRFMHFEMPDYVRNVNYPDQERRLRLYVLKGTGQ